MLPVRAGRECDNGLGDRDPLQGEPGKLKRPVQGEGVVKGMETLDRVFAAFTHSFFKYEMNVFQVLC